MSEFWSGFIGGVGSGAVGMALIVLVVTMIADWWHD